MPAQTIELRFPEKGVIRRSSARHAPEGSSSWCVNARLEDNLDRRLRGGSRPGLTKFYDFVLGAVIADISSINVSSAAGGASEVLFVLADGVIKTLEGGIATGQVAYLTDESGNILTDESANRLTVSSGLIPMSAFLVTGQQHVFGVTTTAIAKMDVKTGQTDNLLASAGTVPTNCTFGAVYRDRLCLSGQDNAIYMSKQGDYTDWDFGEHFENQQRAVPFQLSLGADVGALPTAMIPCLDAYMICASARTLWVLNGDPTADGSLKRVSETVGIIGSKAWVKVDTSIVFLSEDGLYQVNADGSDLKPLTPDVVPDELRNIDVSTTTVRLGWDQDRQAFHIYLRTTGGSDTHWMYEMVSQSFWPMRYQNNHSPLALCQCGGNLLLAGNDGYVRKVTGDDDDGSKIESHVLLGPVKLGELDAEGLVNALRVVLANGSGTVNWRLIVGDSADTATDNGKLAIEAFQAGNSYTAYVAASGTLTAGRSTTKRPRVRGNWACLWLQSTSQWAFEGVTMQISSAGKWRGT